MTNHDDETLRLVRRLTLDFDMDKWNTDEIFSDDFKEFDAYRLYRFFYQLRTPTNEMTKQHFFSKLENIDSSHLFKISDDVRFSLLNVKPMKINKADILGLPFDNIFLDVMIDEKLRDGTPVKIFGLQLFFPMDRTTSKMVFNRDDIFLIRACIFNEKKGFGTTTWTFSLKEGMLKDKKTTINPLDKTIEKFVTNLILFFNEPRVTIRILENNNEKRIQRGKIPIPSQIQTILHYDLKNYIERIYVSGDSRGTIDFAYWVRGHKRKLVSPRYTKKQGQVIWIKPHLVGDGLQPPQIHNIIK